MGARSRRRHFPRNASRQAGFSLVELLVTVVILAEVLVGLLIIFDSSSRLARAQTHLAEVQQSLRVGQSEVVRLTRQVGLGGLPITRVNLPDGQPDDSVPVYNLEGTFPRSGYAVSVLNNVPEGTIVEQTDDMPIEAGTDEVLPGSDVLILRGVFSTPVYYLDPSAARWCCPRRPGSPAVRAGTIPRTSSSSVIAWSRRSPTASRWRSSCGTRSIPTPS